ncbi:nuclear transport factor 2 family protein [Gramella sp. MAR_2010_147]|uniref:nuclear transport factor 2 family protein n=1 Tax=Gramella sp. MAR_2010_147 TaxID=1250205 RepID=UPI00087CC849|nr:nuclear transport factor 2 family protein [Gramella sp. MAR_2010_147]SDR89819.1 conserved hypothetical protein [Gramella sp. MAR_2010_147]
MRNLILIVFSMVFVTSTFLAQSSNQDLNNLRESYIKALKNSDTNAILKVYSKDATIHHVDGTMLTGAKEIKAFYDEFFKSSKASIQFENISEDELTQDVMFYHDKVFLRIEGEEEIRNIEVVNIAKKLDGKWRVIKSYRWPKPK